MRKLITHLNSRIEPNEALNQLAHSTSLHCKNRDSHSLIKTLKGFHLKDVNGFACKKSQPGIMMMWYWTRQVIPLELTRGNDVLNSLHTSSLSSVCTFLVRTLSFP